MTYAKWVQHLLGVGELESCGSYYEEAFASPDAEKARIFSLLGCFGPTSSVIEPATFTKPFSLFNACSTLLCFMHVTEDARDAQDDAQQALVSMAKDNDAVKTLVGPISTVGIWAAVTTSVHLIQSNLLCALKRASYPSLKIRIPWRWNAHSVYHNSFDVWWRLDHTTVIA